MPNFSQFVTRLHDDSAFRQLFANSPAQALQQSGFDPSMFALPKQIDYNQLTQRLNAVFNGQEQVTLNQASDAANLSPDDLWKRFSVIGLTTDTKGLLQGSTASIADSEPTLDVVAVVVYGSSVAVSNSNSAVVAAGANIGIQSVQQLQVLRNLARLPKAQLNFSIMGPDGVAVHNVNADMVDAFLKRAK